jgi:hypothetical protein
VWLGPDQWPGPQRPSVLSRSLRTVSTAARTGEKTGETTGETGETTAGTVAAEPTRLQSRSASFGGDLDGIAVVVGRTTPRRGHRR